MASGVDTQTHGRIQKHTDAGTKGILINQACVGHTQLHAPGLKNKETNQKYNDIKTYKFIPTFGLIAS